MGKIPPRWCQFLRTKVKQSNSCFPKSYELHGLSNAYNLTPWVVFPEGSQVPNDKITLKPVAKKKGAAQEEMTVPQCTNWTPEPQPWKLSGPPGQGKRERAQFSRLCCPWAITAPLLSMAPPRLRSCSVELCSSGLGLQSPASDT